MRLWGFEGPYLATIIHVMNSIGTPILVYALRHGNAMVVVPVAVLSPIITVVLFLILNGVIPDPFLTTGVILRLAFICC